MIEAKKFSITLSGEVEVFWEDLEAAPPSREELEGFIKDALPLDDLYGVHWDNTLLIEWIDND